MGKISVGSKTNGSVAAYCLDSNGNLYFYNVNSTIANPWVQNTAQDKDGNNLTFKNISVSSDGVLCAINTNGTILYKVDLNNTDLTAAILVFDELYNSTTSTSNPSAPFSMVSVGNFDTIYLLANNNLYQLDTSTNTWNVDGSLEVSVAYVAASSNSSVYIISTDHQVFRYDTSTELTTPDTTTTPTATTTVTTPAVPTTTIAPTSDALSETVSPVASSTKIPATKISTSTIARTAPVTHTTVTAPKPTTTTAIEKEEATSIAETSTTAGEEEDVTATTETAPEIATTTPATPETPEKIQQKKDALTKKIVVRSQEQENARLQAERNANYQKLIANKSLHKAPIKKTEPK
jgi:hypothetical protein